MGFGLYKTVFNGKWFIYGLICQTRLQYNCPLRYDIFAPLISTTDFINFIGWMGCKLPIIIIFWHDSLSNIRTQIQQFIRFMILYIRFIDLLQRNWICSNKIFVHLFTFSTLDIFSSRSISIFSFLPKRQNPSNSFNPYFFLISFCKQRHEFGQIR